MFLLLDSSHHVSLSVSTTFRGKGSLTCFWYLLGCVNVLWGGLSLERISLTVGKVCLEHRTVQISQLSFLVELCSASHRSLNPVALLKLIASSFEALSSTNNPHPRPHYVKSRSSDPFAVSWASAALQYGPRTVQSATPG
jgi:hypothetical protein